MSEVDSDTWQLDTQACDSLRKRMKHHPAHMQDGGSWASDQKLELELSHNKPIAVEGNSHWQPCMPPEQHAVLYGCNVSKYTDAT
jgi:hypothetical protein